MDGALIDSQEKVHPRDVQILNNFPPEIQPILVTVRNLHSAKGVLQASGALPQPRFPFPAVFMNDRLACLPKMAKMI